MSIVPGYIWLWKKITRGRSPICTLDYTVFQQLGFDFWDEERMVALGFMVPLSGKHVILNSLDTQELWF